MNKDERIIETSGGYRVILCPDFDAQEPYDEGASPLLRIEVRNRTRAERIAGTAGMTPEALAHIEAAAERWKGPHDETWPLFEKYLKAYWGATRIETWFSGNFWYVTSDPAAWREAVGAEPGSASLDEYRAWCEGDIYGYVIQRRVHWTTEDEDFGDRDLWEDTGNSVWGFYGYDYAVREAKEALADAVKHAENLA